MLGVVVGRLRILVHVKTCKSPHALVKPLVGWVAKSQEHEAAHPFARVEPIRHGDEFLVVRAVFGQLGLAGPEFLILLKVAFESLLEQPEDGIGASQSMEESPVVEGFDRVVGSVESAPSRGMQQVSAMIEILLGEAFACDGIGSKKLPFHQCPTRGRKRCIDNQGDVFRRHRG